VTAVRQEIDGSIGRLTLSRPRRHNALNPGVVRDLLEALDRLESSGVRAAVLAGDGPSFCSGQDISDDEIGSQEASRYIEQLQTVSRRLRALPIPVIAAVHGHALGAGFEIALSCDLILASTDAKFGLPEVEVGLAVGGGATAVLPRIVGLPRAKELVLLGRRIEAAEARQIGLVNEVLDRATLAVRAEELARTLAQREPLALHWGKRGLERGFNGDLGAAYRLESQAMAETSASRRLSAVDGGSRG
jgi:2-(1,2-epoxy-1,2-dihydrophenyl)acetyl-CoA isomerase